MSILSIDPGRKNLGLCILDPGTDPTGRDDTITHWAVVETPLDAPGLIDMMRAEVQGKSFGRVVIERQPPKNNGMKKLEHHLEMYFATLGIPVTVVDARMKLLFAETTPHWKGPAEGVKTIKSYVRRKKLAIGVVTRYLEDSPQNTECAKLFRAAKKQDDYADSFLQAQALAHHISSEKGSPLHKKQKLPKGRAPTTPQARITRPVAIHLVQDCATHDQFESTFGDNARLKFAFLKYFKDIETFMHLRELNGQVK